MRCGKAILAATLVCLLVVSLAGTAFADEGRWTPPAAAVDYRFMDRVDELRNKMVIMDYSKTWTAAEAGVQFWCADEKTANQFCYDGFSLTLPVAVDPQTGKAYAVLPRMIGGELHYGLGPAVPVCYHVGDGVYVGAEGLLVPLADVAQNKAVYVRLDPIWEVLKEQAE